MFSILDSYILKNINNIPILKRAIVNNLDDTLTLKEIVYEHKLQNNAKEKIMQCYLCKANNTILSLKQKPSLSRCADEIIETHFYCKNCA